MEPTALEQLEQQHMREHAELSSTIINMEAELTKRRERIKELNAILNTLNTVKSATAPISDKEE